MKITIAALCLLTFCSWSHAKDEANEKKIPPQKTDFALEGKLPYTVSLSYPRASTLTAHKKIPNGDSIRIKIDDDRDSVGLLAEVHDLKGRTIWSHDFGGNLSAEQGNTISVTTIPGSNTLLVEYDGYKWDHDHKLLLVESKADAPVIREYVSTKKDILPSLQRRKDFPVGYRYWIYPARLHAGGVDFYCLPLAIKDAPHPIASEITYRVITKIDANHKITPVQIKAGEE